MLADPMAGGRIGVHATVSVEERIASATVDLVSHYYY